MLGVAPVVPFALFFLWFMGFPYKVTPTPKRVPFTLFFVVYGFPYKVTPTPKKEVPSLHNLVFWATEDVNFERGSKAYVEPVSQASGAELGDQRGPEAYLFSRQAWTILEPLF